MGRRTAEPKAASGAGERCLCVQATSARKTLEILAFVRATTVRWGWGALVIEPTKGLVKANKKATDPEVKSGTEGMRDGRRRVCDFRRRRLCISGWFCEWQR